MSLIGYLTRIHFAENVLTDALGEELARLKATRPFVVIDDESGADDGLGLLEDALPANCDAAWAPTTRANRARRPQCALLDRLRQQIKDAGCDVIVAFGGRTALSTGRRLANTTQAPLPLIAVPTTTSDMGLASGSPASRCKALPAAVLCDPILTYSLDASRTAAFGFDALTHCIEAFLAPGYNPPADGIALEGIHRAFRYLEQAVAADRAPEARREVMAAALNGALAGQKGLGGVEALARAIEGQSEAALPHGRLHATLLPRVLSFNAPAVGDRYGRIATAMGAAADADPVDALARLGTRLGLPDRLGPLRLAPARLRQVATDAAADPANQTNPRHAKEEDYMALLAQAI